MSKCLPKGGGKPTGVVYSQEVSPTGNVYPHWVSNLEKVSHNVVLQELFIYRRCLHTVGV